MVSGLTQISETIIFGSETYDLCGQLSHKDNHIYTRLRDNLTSQFFKMDYKSCTSKQGPANPKNTMIAIYKNRTASFGQEDCSNYSKYVYPPSSVQYFRRSTEEYKKTQREKYDKNEAAREEKKGKQKHGKHLFIPERKPWVYFAN